MKPTRNPWPLAVIAAFVIFIAATAGLVTMACSQKMDLVSKDYYEQELQFQTHLDGLRHADQLTSPAAVRYDSSTRLLTLSFPPEHARASFHGQVQFYRPSASSLDQRLDLHPDPLGQQQIDTSRLPAGLWKVRVQWNVGNKDFVIEKSLLFASPVGS